MIQNQEAFFQEVMAKNTAIRSLRAQASVQVEAASKRYRFQANILMDQSGSFFVETYGFGVPQSYVSFVKNQLTIVSMSDHSIYKGDGPSSLSKFLDINVSTREFVKALLHEIPMIDPSSKVLANKNEYVVTNKNQSMCWIDGDRWIKKISTPETDVSTEYGAPLKSTMPLYPSSIKILQGEDSVFMSFKEVVMNQEIDQKAFQIDIPSNHFEVHSIQ